MYPASPESLALIEHARSLIAEAKGELRQGLRVGLDYDEDDRVVLSPDEAVLVR